MIYVHRPRWLQISWRLSERKMLNWIWLQYHMRHIAQYSYYVTAIKVVITMTSHERHVISNHRSSHCLFNSLCRLASTKQNPHYRPYVRRTHRGPVHSPQKGPVTRKKLTFDNVINVRHGLGGQKPFVFHYWRLRFLTAITLHVCNGCALLPPTNRWLSARLQ